MTEFTRKIQIVGNRSYAVSLPKKWVIKNNLEKKEVNILEKEGNLILSPKKISQNSSTKEIIIEDLELIPSILLLCYTRAVAKVKLIFKTKENYLSAKPIILEILSHLEGFKIINDNNNNILISESYENSNISIQYLAKRMVIILNNMVDCILSNNTKTKKILENESDSLYHFSKRILYIYGNKFNLLDNNLEEIFLWRLIFKKLENIGDILEKSTKESFTKEKIHAVLNKINDYILLQKKIKISEIQKLKDTEFKSFNNNKIKELVIDILNNLLLIDLNKTYFSD
ncbi:MAG: AbrB/MazE/SpoVT family DNA-binding domain-containing protein [Candidatus Woesearchaeota archaeon]